VRLKSLNGIISNNTWSTVGYLLTSLIFNILIIFYIIDRRDSSSLNALVFQLFIIVTLVGFTRFAIFVVLYVKRRKRRWLARIPSGQWPTVTVLIPCFNEEEVIASTLQSLLAMDYPCLDVMVIDDGSTDSTVSIVQTFEPRVKLIRQLKGGKAAALNHGITALDSDLALLVDADCLFPRRTLKLAVRYLLNQGDDAIGGHLAVANTNTRLGQLQHLEYGGILLSRFFTRYSLNLQRTQDIIPGALGLFRTTVLRRAGPLSTNLLAEDVDLTARLIQQGCYLSYCPYLACTTVVPETVHSLRIQRRRWVQGYLQVVLKQLASLPSSNSRTRMATLAMACKIIAWPLTFFLGLFYIIQNCRDGYPAILWLSLAVAPFPLSLQGLVRFRESDLKNLILFAYGYSHMIFAWRLFDQSLLFANPSPTWRYYRRLRSIPEA